MTSQYVDGCSAKSLSDIANVLLRQLQFIDSHPAVNGCAHVADSHKADLERAQSA